MVATGTHAATIAVDHGTQGLHSTQGLHGTDEILATGKRSVRTMA